MLFAVSLLLLCTGIFASEDIQCKSIPGKLRQIDAGAGGVFGVNSNDDIYQWVDNNWKNIAGKLIHVSVGPAGIWGVNRANNIYKIQDNKWVSVSGLLKQVDAGGNKFLGGVNSQDNIYCLRQSCTVSESSALSWTQLDGALKYYSCGPLGCWGVNSADNIYFRYNVSPTACQGTQWQQIEGALEMIEVGTDGSVYGVNSAGNVYRRDGISAKTPTGTSWTQLDFCTTFKHVTYDNGYLWLITPTDDILQCSLNA
ncbi:fish-egg lectin-like [Aquarana catesbeiana]|uniref:fish-egg lectin-like n=1 Tax=Aquarana catesbeiana TaxID=8400 RepID=UPI003CC9C3FD